MTYKKPPSFYNGVDYSNLLSRKALFGWIREFIEKSGIVGSYWEFGVFQGESMKEAQYILRDVVAHYIGFDSFKGLPVLKHHLDKRGSKYSPEFVQGNYKSISEKFVRENIISAGMPADKLFLFPGFFDKTLNFKNFKSFLKDKKKIPSVIYIDVDLYESTKQVLDFIYPLLQTGCWILFDDYWCYRGASQFGTQKAIKEFLGEHKDILFQEYSSYRGWSKAFIVEVLE